MSPVIDAMQTAKLAQVAQLATAVAERVLDAQIFDLSVPPAQITALASAARLLQDNGVPWPPLVEQVLHELAENSGKLAEGAGIERTSEGDSALTGLTRFLGAFRREKDLPVQQV
ncbi:hypothetical protein MKK69_25445 [Methylobacterium sp. J-026]|uniref:hypothetical protein n=1 Tax=Methylobacterium sp. J-026 TaxID=2836624 RepID=UPI001FBA50C1|nr:hypothetical protein [Methylobacterium sp. J-026]MCJ2137349.1 hypothetical protein [Methylobacterium sp. J-026]